MQLPALLVYSSQIPRLMAASGSKVDGSTRQQTSNIHRGPTCCWQPSLGDHTPDTPPAMAGMQYGTNACPEQTLEGHTGGKKYYRARETTSCWLLHKHTDQQPELPKYAQQLMMASSPDLPCKLWANPTTRRLYALKTVMPMHDLAQQGIMPMHAAGTHLGSAWLSHCLVLSTISCCCAKLLCKRQDD